MTQDFWLTSGWHLLIRDENGHMVPTLEFMRAYFMRDEVAPESKSCPAELALHKKLNDDPFASVVPTDLYEIVDKDVVHNYQAVLRFRDFLSNYNSLEDAYMAITRGAKIQFPPLFVEQMTQIILRNILDGVTDPMQIRAAELMFRDQVVTLDEGRIMVADQETVKLQIGIQRMQVEDAAGNETVVDIMASETADEYWQRSDQFNTSVDIAFTQPALDGLARVMEKWVKHFLSLNVRVTPMLQIEDDKWAWHLGLDAQATSILNDLYHDKNVSESRLKQILCLFKLEADSGFVTEMQGKPVYMGLAMDAAGVVRFKPQNLLINLPLAASS